MEKIKKYKSLIFFIVIIILGLGQRDEPYIEVDTDTSVFDGRFYYAQLSEEDQVIYQEVYQGVMDHVKEINVHASDPEQVNEVLEYVMYDFPELFWVDGSATSTAYSETLFSDGYTTMEPTYVYSKKERESREKEINNAVSNIVANVPEEYSEYEKVKYVYEYLIDNVEYVEEAPDNQNLYSALVAGETVCAGYAKANQYVLNELGVACIYIVGTATDAGVTESHAWNMVQCGENCYYVDVTWADPIVEEANEKFQSERIYDYLCCSAEELADTHTLDSKYGYPECLNVDLEYYRQNQMYYDVIDKAVLQDALDKSVDEKADSVTFKFADEVYEEGKEAILGDLMEAAAQRLCNIYQLQQVEYYYEENPTVNRVTVYWQYE